MFHSVISSFCAPWRVQRCSKKGRQSLSCGDVLGPPPQPQDFLSGLSDESFCHTLPLDNVLNYLINKASSEELFPFAVDKFVDTINPRDGSSFFCYAAFCRSVSGPGAGERPSLTLWKHDHNDNDVLPPLKFYLTYSGIHILFAQWMTTFSPLITVCSIVCFLMCQSLWSLNFTFYFWYQFNL